MQNARIFIVQKQEQILQQQGPVNPLVNQQQYYQTLVKTLENAGYATSQFFSDPAPLATSLRTETVG